MQTDVKNKVIQDLALKVAQLEIDNAYLKAEVEFSNTQKQEVNTDVTNESSE